MPKPISAAFPYASKYVDVLGAKMHYVDEGEGAPILFLHGNPTSSYLWRNIIPYLVPVGRCIAPDLIGMGKSDKPDLHYRFSDHARYLDAFIAALDLQDITLVLHDWGSALGFDYAARHSTHIKGIAFMEAIIREMSWSDFPVQTRIAFRIMRSPGLGTLLRWLTLGVMNGFIKGVLPRSILRPLSAEEMAYYGAPYKTLGSRKPLRQWLAQVPVSGQPPDVCQSVRAYNQWLRECSLPKILFYASPGMAIGQEDVSWCKQHLANLTVVDLGEGIHFLQEDHPHQIGEALHRWYQQVVSSDNGAAAR